MESYLLTAALEAHSTTLSGTEESYGLINVHWPVLQSRGRSSLRVSMRLKASWAKSRSDDFTLTTFVTTPVSWPPAGEVTAIVIGAMCGCVGLAVIVRFIVKTIR